MNQQREQRGRQLAIMQGDRGEPVREYIQNTRSILLAEIAMRDKYKETKRMQEYIERKESILSLNKEIYEADKKMVNEYVDFMKEKAENQKKSADEKAKERKKLETELDNLKRTKTDLGKSIGDDIERAKEYKASADFIFSLKPSILHDWKQKKAQRKAHGPRLVNVKNESRAFITEQEVRQTENQMAFSNSANDSELTELKKELGISETDSDSELDTGYTDKDQILAEMEQKEEKNLELIEISQKRKQSLDALHKDLENKYQISCKKSEQIQHDLKELAEEANQKSLKLKELSTRLESDPLDSKIREDQSEEKKEQARKVESYKRKIKKKILNIYSIAINGKPTLEKNHIIDNTSTEEIIEKLAQIEAYFRHKKELRELCFSNAQSIKEEEKIIIKENKITDDMNRIRLPYYSKSSPLSQLE